MLIKKYFLKSENSERNKIMISEIHYFITKLKTKIYVIPRGHFNFHLKHTSNRHVNNCATFNVFSVFVYIFIVQLELLNVIIVYDKVFLSSLQLPYLQTKGVKSRFV